MSHDLRNPLNVAQDSVSLLREDLEDEHVDGQNTTLCRIESIVDDVLRMTRLGWTIEECETVDLGELAEQSWRLAETKDATLAVEDIPPVRLDPNMARQLLEDLFRNSVEYGVDDATTDGGASALAVQVGELPQSDGFYVEDNGRGIPESDREQVFEPGYSTNRDGTG